MNIVIVFIIFILLLISIGIIFSLIKAYFAVEKVLISYFLNLLKRASKDKELENRIASLIYTVEKAGEGMFAGAMVALVIEADVALWKIFALFPMSYYIKETGRLSKNKFYKALRDIRQKTHKEKTLEDAKKLLSSVAKG